MTTNRRQTPDLYSASANGAQITAYDCCAWSFHQRRSAEIDAAATRRKAYDCEQSCAQESNDHDFEVGRAIGAMDQMIHLNHRF